MWPIEENASRGRICVCIRPPKPPTKAFKEARVGNTWEWVIFSLRIHRGAIFCQVDKIRRVNQLRSVITAGSQLWKGDIPIFINRANRRAITWNGLRRGPSRKMMDA